ncbi:MAG TPA: hypothetical protein VK756_08845 [Solirubrobacteraceae bacterium]|nr:hypothetical protein [Solirubrobacteraceae bacterium]
MPIALVHLVWAPLGVEPLRVFLRSYQAHPAGAEHELVILLNGFGSDGADPDGRGARPPSHESPARAATPGDDAPTPLTREALAVELHGVERRLVDLEAPLLDLAAYGEAARRLQHEWLCFVNSYGVILADGWLGALARAAAQPDVGLVGATGSWESRAELVPGPPMHWIYQLAKLPGNRRGFPRFPNPHIRSSAFMLRREHVLALGLERARDKQAAYLLESGRRSITRQIHARGLRAVVVGRDGRAYESDDWPRSATFRAGEQANLLVADNRTAQWQYAAPDARASLSRQAWRDAR